MLQIKKSKMPRTFSGRLHEHLIHFLHNPGEHEGVDLLGQCIARANCLKSCWFIYIFYFEVEQKLNNSKTFDFDFFNIKIPSYMHINFATNWPQTICFFGKQKYECSHGWRCAAYKITKLIHVLEIVLTILWKKVCWFVVVWFAQAPPHRTF